MNVDIDADCLLRITFWVDEGYPNLMSVRFLDVTGQILGEMWVSGEAINESTYEELVDAVHMGIAVVTDLLEKQAMSKVVNPAQLREVLVSSSLTLLIDGCILAGLREEKKPDWAEEIVVDLSEEDVE